MSKLLQHQFYLPATLIFLGVQKVHRLINWLFGESDVCSGWISLVNAACIGEIYDAHGRMIPTFGFRIFRSAKDFNTTHTFGVA